MSSLVRTFFVTFLTFLGSYKTASAATESYAQAQKCLALNIYFEARGEEFVGQIAVGAVTLNRVGFPSFAPTVCKVVYDYKQFSWTFDEYSDIPRERKSWNNIMQLARKILDGQTTDPTNKASHYFNPAKANPDWAHKFKITAKIGNHTFYRMPGFYVVEYKPYMNHKTSLQDNLDPEFQNFMSYIDQLPEEDLNTSDQTEGIFMDTSECKNCKVPTGNYSL